jgi:hypothetical protein
MTDNLFLDQDTSALESIRLRRGHDPPIEETRAAEMNEVRFERVM